MSYRPNNRNNSNRWRNGHYEGNYNIGDPYPIKNTWANIGHITERVYVNHFPDLLNNELEIYFLCGLPNFFYGNENSLKFEKKSIYPKKFRGVYPYVYFVETDTSNVMKTAQWYIDGTSGKVKPYIAPILPSRGGYNSNCCFGINGKASFLSTFTAEQNPEITLNGKTFSLGIYSSRDWEENGETVYQWRAIYNNKKNLIFPYGRGYIDENGIKIVNTYYRYHNDDGTITTFEMKKGKMYTPYIFTIIKKNMTGTEDEIMSEVVTIAKELLNLYWDITEYPEIKNYDLYDESDKYIMTLNYNKKERTNGFKNRNKKFLDTNVEKVKPGFILPYQLGTYAYYDVVEKQTINL